MAALARSDFTTDWPVVPTAGALTLAWLIAVQCLVLLSEERVKHQPTIR